MTTQTEAFKLALNALETERDIYRENDEDGAPEYILEAITAIEEAWAQPEQWQKPVGDVLIDHEDEDGHAVIWLRDYALENGRHLLYTTPPQRTWVGMSKEEKRQFLVGYFSLDCDRRIAIALMDDYEAYLKEKIT